ncbi:MAG TPA: hypothetical protein DEO86_05555 [Colwellia sp.]|nr:hypothetical protein [Colwellia sp.]|tara:strand:+ start:646 stop:1224 length:579 start_codon:yes stop_codon:yes gene_type:complete
MATTATPYGARPVGTLSASGSFTGKTMQIKVASAYATNIFHGDFVKLVTAGTVELDAGTATVTTVGIFLGCKYTDPSTNQMTFNQYWPASTAASDAVAYVLTDPQALFQMQGDGTLAQSALGANFGLVQTAGSTSIGKSKNAADVSTVATTNTLPLKLVEFVDSTTSAVGDTYTDAVYKVNVGHQFDNTTGI